MTEPLQHDARIAPPPRDCRCCVKPGERHQSGCDVERCALCGGQLISCDCVYELNGYVDLEVEAPEVWKSGPSDSHWAVYDQAVAELGGPLLWEGEYPGSAQAREFGLFCRMIEGQGWTKCEPTHPEARTDLNRLVSSYRWDRQARRWVERQRPLDRRLS